MMIALIIQKILYMNFLDVSVLQMIYNDDGVKRLSDPGFE